MSALAGRRIVVTRARRQADQLCALLRDQGAQALLYPCIDFAPPADCGQLQQALFTAARGGFGWIVLTSVNTVEYLALALESFRMALPETIRLAAIGPATAGAAKRLLGRAPDFVPEEFHSDALGASLPLADDARVLLPQSDLADDSLAERIRARGARVCRVQAYRTALGSGGVDLPRLLARGDIDAITLTSGSCALNLHERLGREGGISRVPDDVAFACIGRKTAMILQRQFGYTNIIAAGENQSLPALVAALQGSYETSDARTTR